MLDLLKIFKNLTLPIEGDHMCFSADVIQQGWNHRVARSVENRPSVLLCVARRDGFLPSIALENLTIIHDVPCRVTARDGTSVEDRFSVITCNSNDETIQDKFLSLLSPLVFAIGSAPSEQQLNELINDLVFLFRSLDEPPMKSLRGVWSELFLISVSSDPRVLAQSWHSTPEEKYDFSHEHERLEVKSSSNRSRSHHFSIEQLSPPAGASLLVGSLFVETLASGPSIGELYEKIRRVVWSDPETLTKFDRVFHSSIGNHWNTSTSVRFDPDLALDSLSFYRLEDIPRITGPLPVGVSKVHFDSMLPRSGINPENITEYGKLFAALVSDILVTKRDRKTNPSRSRN
jgi:hypothetical protein